MTEFNAAEMVSTATADEEIRRAKLESLRERGLTNVCDLAMGFKARCEERRRHPPVRTGLRQLDKELGGLRPGYYVLGGDTGTGKTALAMQIAGNVASNGGKVLIASLEMEADLLFARDLSRFMEEHSPYSQGIGFKADEIMLGRTSEHLERAMAGYLSKTAPNIEIFTPEGWSRPTGEKIADICREYEEATKIKPTLVITDYLQLLGNPFDSPNASEKQGIDKNIEQLFRFARNYGVPVLLLSQYNRASNGKPVSNSALSGSGVIEQHSEATLLLDVYRTEQDEANKVTADEIVKQSENAGKPVPVLLRIPKNRHGPRQATAYFAFDGAHALYREATREDLEALRGEAFQGQFSKHGGARYRTPSSAVPPLTEDELLMPGRIS